MWLEVARSNLQDFVDCTIPANDHDAYIRSQILARDSIHHIACMRADKTITCDSCGV